jgi:hypothetical protein
MLQDEIGMLFVKRLMMVDGVRVGMGRSLSGSFLLPEDERSGECDSGKRKGGRLTARGKCCERRKRVVDLTYRIGHAQRLLNGLRGCHSA